MKFARLAAAFAAALAIGTAAPGIARAQVGVEVTIVNAPPAPLVETVVIQPSVQHVWHRGHWLWNPETNSYFWHPGHWVQAPAPGLEWYADQWVFFNAGWRFLPGHWRVIGAPPPPPPMQMVAVQVAPPPVIQEVVTIQPTPAHAWIHGHYSWNGYAYLWTPGHWMVVPQGVRSWQPGHWYASRGYWFYVSGYWRR